MLLVAALLVGCSAPPDRGDDSMVGTSELAPDGAAAPAKADRSGKQPRREKGKQVKAHRSPVEHAKPAQHKPKEPGDAKGPRSDGAGGRPAAATISASLTDPAGDVRGALTGAPPYADLVGARLTRGGGFEVAVTFAGTVPDRQSDDRIVQVVTFFDLDGDGETDYEVWASLADDGWGTSYRSPDSARFGDESEVSVETRGRTLLISFPVAHLEGARRLGWAVGAEWGTLEQVAAGTTAQDNAPDGGWARLRGVSAASPNR